MPAHDHLEIRRHDGEWVASVPRSTVGRRSGTTIDPNRHSVPHPECNCDVCEDHREAGVYEYHFRCQARHRPMEDCPRRWCDDCCNSGFITPAFAHNHCSSCGSPVRTLDLFCDDCVNGGDHDDDYDDDDDDNDCHCLYCAPGREYDIHDYSYRPQPTFYGDGPLYLGMELELEIRNTVTSRTATSRIVEQCAKVANDALGHGDLGYLKLDGSLSTGFEIVSHPMSYPYFLEHFPWEMLRELRSRGGYITNGCGIHVHVSKAGFKSERHKYAWLSWWHRSKDEVTTFARRDPTEWAAFDDAERRNVKHYAKGRYGGRNVYPERYVAVNVCPLDTYEVRVFKSTLDHVKAKASLGLVDSSVRYAAQLRAKDALNGAWSWPGYREWLFNSDNDRDYRPLKQTINRIGV